MKQQNGSTLVVSLVLLTIITLVAVYSLEGSNIQSKMVANSLFSTLTYQECRNEQEANIRFYNADGGANRNELLDIQQLPETLDPITNEPMPPTKIVDSITMGRGSNMPKSDSITVSWSYIKEDPSARGGYNIDTDSQSRAFIYENHCQSEFRFAINSQTLGAVVEGLVADGNKN